MTDDYSKRRDGVTVPTIYIAIALSVLLHVALLWKWLPNLKLPSPELDERAQAKGAIVVQLAPPPRPPSPPPSAPSVEARPAPAPKVRAAPPPPRPRPSPPVLALRTPSPAAPSTPAPAPPAPPAPPEPPRAQPQRGDDFASFVEARRRARGESSPPPSPGGAPNMQQAETDNERANRIAAENLAPKRQTFGYDPRQGGGVFQLVRVGYSDAEFLFYGWNKEIRRNTKQLIEVQKGNNPDTRIAVVRKMIAIIREYEREDFLWESQRLGRSLTLSARERDTASLERFLMQEFFDDPLRPAPLR